MCKGTELTITLTLSKKKSFYNIVILVFHPKYQNI
jgi:hypothetical protein